MIYIRQRRTYREVIKHENMLWQEPRKEQIEEALRNNDTSKLWVILRQLRKRKENSANIIVEQ